MTNIAKYELCCTQCGLRMSLYIELPQDTEIVVEDGVCKLCGGKMPALNIAESYE